jgi:hypothetical protein
LPMYTCILDDVAGVCSPCSLTLPHSGTPKACGSCLVVVLPLCQLQVLP